MDVDDGGPATGEAAATDEETTPLLLQNLIDQWVLTREAWVYPNQLEPDARGQTRQLIGWRVEKAVSYLARGWCDMFTAMVRALPGTTVEDSKGYRKTPLLKPAQGTTTVAACGDTFHRHAAMTKLLAESHSMTSSSSSSSSSSSLVPLDHDGRMKAVVLRHNTPDDVFRKINELINITHDSANPLTFLDLCWRMSRLTGALRVEGLTTKIAVPAKWSDDKILVPIVKFIKNLKACKQLDNILQLQQYDHEGLFKYHCAVLAEHHSDVFTDSFPSGVAPNFQGTCFLQPTSTGTKVGRASPLNKVYTQFNARYAMPGMRYAWGVFTTSGGNKGMSTREWSDMTKAAELVVTGQAAAPGDSTDLRGCIERVTNQQSDLSVVESLRQSVTGLDQKEADLAFVYACAGERALLQALFDRIQAKYPDSVFAKEGQCVQGFTSKLAQARLDELGKLKLELAGTMKKIWGDLQQLKDKEKAKEKSRNGKLTAAATKIDKVLPSNVEAKVPEAQWKLLRARASLYQVVKLHSTLSNDRDDASHEMDQAEEAARAGIKSLSLENSVIDSLDLDSAEELFATTVNSACVCVLKQHISHNQLYNCR
jgi:hypothetical protein